jgi:hypothetical protein
MFQEQQKQAQELIKTFNIADPNYPGNQQSRKKYWVKILLTEYQLGELRNLAILILRQGNRLSTLKQADKFKLSHLSMDHMLM